MKVGINLVLWTGHVDEAHVSILRALADTGFDGVEIPIFAVDDVGHYARLGAMLDDLGLARTAIGPIPDQAHSPISANPAERQAATDRLRRVVDWCSALGAEILAGSFYQPLGLFSGAFPSEAELEHCAEVHRAILPDARAAGITLAIEPLNRFEAHLINTCEQGMAYVDRVGEAGLGLLYDTFHAHIEEQDPIAALKSVQAADMLAHVHISENDRGTPGRGHAKIHETIRTLKGAGYDGWLTIEAFGRAVPELAAATRVWRDFFADPEDVYTEGYRYITSCWED